MRQRSVQSCHGDKQLQDHVRKSQAPVAFAELSCSMQPPSSRCSASSSSSCCRCFLPSLAGGCLTWYAGGRGGIPNTLPSAAPVDKKKESTLKKKKGEIFDLFHVFVWLLELELKNISHKLPSSVQGYSLRSSEGRSKTTWQENTVTLNLQPLNLGKLSTWGAGGGRERDAFGKSETA